MTSVLDRVHMPCMSFKVMNPQKLMNSFPVVGARSAKSQGVKLKECSCAHEGKTPLVWFSYLPKPHQKHPAMQLFI